MEKIIRVIDKRSREKFIVDDVYLNGYGKLFGPTISAVYLSLCRHANKEQEAWPSEKKMADEWCLTERTVRRAIKILKENNLIDIAKFRTDKGIWMNNNYILLDKKVWKKPEDIQFLWTTRGHERTKPEDIKVKTRGHGSPIKGNTYKETHIRKDFFKKNDDGTQRDGGLAKVGESVKSAPKEGSPEWVIQNCQ